MDVTTRLATVDDAEAVATAHLRAWKVAYQGIVPQPFLDGLDVDDRVELWHSILNGDFAVEGVDRPTDYAAVAGGDVVGFANIGPSREFPDDPAMGELWAMYVDPDHWGSGAGFALMNQTMAHFESAGVRHGYLWVFEENALARRFYERQGWGVDDVTRTDEVGGEDIAERRYSIEI